MRGVMVCFPNGAFFYKMNSFFYINRPKYAKKGTIRTIFVKKT